MALSVFDLFSVGIGPSSSHTVGPMRAAATFRDEIPAAATRVMVELFGSLGATGYGHGTPGAVVLGLLGELPETVDPRAGAELVERVRVSRRIDVGHEIRFRIDGDILLRRRKQLPLHPNGMIFRAYADDIQLCEHTFYSIGGGFVVDGATSSDDRVLSATAPVPHDFHTAAELLARVEATGKSIARIVLENELTWRTEDEVRADLLHIWGVMQGCVQAGIDAEGYLPGGLQVRRRAPELAAKLSQDSDSADPMRGLDWVTLFALAVNEENAAGGRVVTAPTNGAAGIIPAVLHYYTRFVPGASEDGVLTFLLTAGAIGMIFKQNASISGAEVGCQGEVGSACSMAAAGMAAVMGGSPQQIENAAEIGMEHNLGLTCDPVGGLVQIPCIERNAIASVKAIAAARTALRGDGRHVVSLDKVIKTMRDTGRDMKIKYKETARGGLAVNVTEC